MSMLWQFELNPLTATQLVLWPRMEDALQHPVGQVVGSWLLLRESYGLLVLVQGLGNRSLPKRVLWCLKAGFYSLR